MTLFSLISKIFRDSL